MRIRVLGSHGSRVPGFHTSCMLINDNLLLDVGTVSAILDLNEQATVDHVVLTHAHLDHVVDLAFLVDNVFTLRREPLRIWGPAQVLESVQIHLFNNEIWPDFSRIKVNGFPLVEFCPLAPGVVTEIAGVRFAWVQTNHVVFTAGYLITAPSGSVLHSGDTSTTSELWKMGRDCSDLRLAFVETSFPNRLEAIARASGHLTPAMLREELAKLDRPELPVKVFHMKPQFIGELCAELDELHDSRLQILSGGEVFNC
jgi:ribonuclease BN (tRNA processing enzyme)